MGPAFERIYKTCSRRDYIYVRLKLFQNYSVTTLGSDSWAKKLKGLRDSVTRFSALFLSTNKDSTWPGPHMNRQNALSNFVPVVVHFADIIIEYLCKNEQVHEKVLAYSCGAQIGSFELKKCRSTILRHCFFKRRLGQYTVITSFF